MIIKVLPKNSEIITTKASININSYELYTNIEQNVIIQGIALYVSNILIVEETKFNTNSNEIVLCTLKLKANDKLLLGCIYRSHTDTQIVCNLLQEVSDKRPSHLLITGYFNYPDIDW